MDKSFIFIKKIVLYASVVLNALPAFARPLPDAYKALSVYDYFKAKYLFSKLSQNNTKAYADYGLAIIFSRKDNPFHNLDSAAKYCHSGLVAFITYPVPLCLSGFNINESNMRLLLDSVAGRNLLAAKKVQRIKVYETFLCNNYLANTKFIKEAIYLRDELEFNQLLQINKSDSTILFMVTHPQSSFISEAVLLRDKQIFDESTQLRTADSYIYFLRHYPKNTMIPKAYEDLYGIYRQSSDIKGLQTFVHNYPNAPQINEAWKLLFALSVSSYSDEELIRFLSSYPEFPLKKSILKELQLSQLLLYPYKNDDLFGFVDSSAKLRISPQYEEVKPFYEGLAVVSRNDSVFYINKENQNVFGDYYEEAYSFKNGIAAVKKAGKWIFINRQAQAISAACEEVNELADGIYVFKYNQKYGAIDHFGRKIIEPRFELLGDFKNGYAYYAEGARYGFVSKSGFVFRAQFDWISDFDSNERAIIRINNKYGLINPKGNLVLEAAYDQIMRLEDKVYLLVAGDKYGFFEADGCFISQVIFDYHKERAETDYYHQAYFRLIKNNSLSMMDENGAIRINFGIYDEIGFASSGLFRVKKKDKFGYVDRKLQTVIPYQYEWAADFEDSLALVKLKGKYMLINTKGEGILISDFLIQKIAFSYYLCGMDEDFQLFDSEGKLIVNGIKHFQRPEADIILLTLNSGEIKLLKDETFVNLKSKTEP